MYALTDRYDIDRDRNHERKAKIRAERVNQFRNTKPCDRCEGFGTLIDLFSEIDCHECNGLGRIKKLYLVK
jgi:DnaJ-class molecular chaperone